MKNIFAYTEPTPISGYPAYLSVNQIAEDDGQNIVFTVRSSGNGIPQEVRLTYDQAEGLAKRLLNYLNED